MDQLSYKILNSHEFAQRLLKWYPKNRRELPWRETDDPYIIWLSEIILQQTRVAQGLPYFHTFLNQFPNVHSLAEAPLSQIMRCWQGLGYYSRARNLHACAQQIVRDWEGRFPGNYEALLSLKGVGTYTAAAIASFAFGEQVAVVDGNVYRVLARHFGLKLDVSTHQGKKGFESMANQVIPSSDPGMYNQAIMEFGALQCVPKSPDCPSCPLLNSCYAHSTGEVGQLPVKTKKVKVKKRYFTYFHIRCNGFTVVRERGAGDIWQGLVDFPMDEKNAHGQADWENGEQFTKINEFVPKNVEVFNTRYKHVLSHQLIFATFVQINLSQPDLEALRVWAERQDYRLIKAEELEALGKPILIAKYLIDCE
jgi:A/G-specific adenine glycosylase